MLYLRADTYDTYKDRTIEWEKRKHSYDNCERTTYAKIFYLIPGSDNFISGNVNGNGIMHKRLYSIGYLL